MPLTNPKNLTVNYFPFPKQAEFHRSRGKVFARLVSAATGGGKTYAGAYESFLWAMECSNSVGYAFEPTYKMVKRNLIPTLENLLGKPLETSPFIKEYNKTDSKLTFITDSQLWMIGLDDPESAEGPNVDWIWSDESRLLHDFATAWQVWMRRLRGSVPGRHRVGIWLTTTPNAPNSDLFGLFENPKTRLPNSQVFRWAIDDNVHLTEAYKAEVKRSHTGGMYKRFVEGLFSAVGVGSFDFDYTVHVVDALPVEIRKVAYGVDFGWTNPSAIICIGYDYDDRVYVLDEFYQNRVRLETLIEELKDMMQKHGEGAVVCDRSEPRSIEEFQIAGLNAQANESKREEGIRELGGRLKKAEDNRPRLYILNRCVNLVSEMQIFDEAKKENDHAVDALRYAVCGESGGLDYTISFGRRP